MTATNLFAQQESNRRHTLWLVSLFVLFFAWLLLSKGWTSDERKRLIVISVLFLGAAVFWSVFEQAGSTLTLFAERSNFVT